jgi:uncharacterized protein YdiU (UPF0061 family)
VEEALESAIAGNMNLFNTLLDLLRAPYTPNTAFRKYQVAPQEEWEENYRTFCGT